MYNKIIKLGLEKGLTDIEIFASKSKTHSLSVYKQEVESNVKSNVESIVIKGIYNGKKAAIRTEHIDDKKIDLMLNLLIDSARAITVSEPAIIFEGSKEYPVVEFSTFDFDSVDMKTKIDFLKEIETLILAHPETKSVDSTNYFAVESKTNIVNSKGLNLSRHHTFAYAYAEGVFARGDDIKTADELKVVKDFKDFNAKEIAEKTIEKGVALIGGKSIPSGASPVVFSNEMFADIIDVFYSNFTGEAAYRKLTLLKDKVGQKIACDNFCLLEDPLYDEALFKVPFDDEGVACYKRDIIKDGVFMGFSHNLKTAAIFNEEPTGNGFLGGIGATNLYVKPGVLSFDELIKDIQDGVYITDLVGLHAGVNDVSGDFNLQAGGFKIINGKIDHPVKMIVLSGNFYQMINEIKAIGNDLKFSIDGTGSPSVYIEKLMIGGQD